MKLRVRLFELVAGRTIAIISEKSAHKIGVHTNERLQIEKNGKKAVAIADLVSSDALIRENEIAVSSELMQEMDFHENEEVDVDIAPMPKSLQYIRNKMRGEKLTEKEILELIQDLVNDLLPETEIAFFITAVYSQGMDLQEIEWLIKAFSSTGNKLKFKEKIIADKHSIGGVAGNRTTPIVVAICAAAGLLIPKNSSRAITSAAGTADVIETIANVDCSLEEIYSIIKKTNACLIWGGSLDLVPADEKIIAIEKTLKLDEDAFLLASILSKKIAAGSTHIIIDIPYGKSAKVDKKHALALKKKFEFLGRLLHRKVVCVLTDGSQPIGNGIGPALELQDVISVLKQTPNKPNDLEKKSIFLAGKLLELTGKSKTNHGQKDAQEILSSGKAFEKFKQIISAQKGKLTLENKTHFTQIVKAKHSMYIKHIDNEKISSLARICGCPSDKYAGIVLHVHVGDRIKKNQALLTLYTESKSRLHEAMKFIDDNFPVM